jgi:predicted metal-dependent hydrolase
MKRFTAPYMGKIRDVIERRQWTDIKFESDRFFISPKLAKNFNLFVKKYDEYCISQLAKIIQSGIDSLKNKKVKVKLEYLRGNEKFLKEVRMSIMEYLKEIGFSQKIKFEIGHYEKEWGINQINPKQKNFVLFFNQNLIKYDSGQHIKHVVAHELAHIFVRNHGPEFHSVLAQLDPNKHQSENFFSKGIAKVFQNPVKANSGLLFYVLILAIITLLGFWLYNQIIDWLAQIFSNNNGNNF